MLILPTDGDEAPFYLSDPVRNNFVRIYPEVQGHDGYVYLHQAFGGLSIPVDQLEGFANACRKAAERAKKATEEQ